MEFPKLKYLEAKLYHHPDTACLSILIFYNLVTLMSNQNLSYNRTVMLRNKRGGEKGGGGCICFFLFSEDRLKTIFLYLGNVVLHFYSGLEYTLQQRLLNSSRVCPVDGGERVECSIILPVLCPVLILGLAC